MLLFLNPAGGMSVCAQCLQFSGSLCVMMLISLVLCLHAHPEHPSLLCQQARLALQVNMIEFMRQQTCHSTLSGILVIEVI